MVFINTKEEFYKYNYEEVISKLSSTKNGLTNEEVSKRQKQYGLNILPSKKEKTIFEIFFSGFKDPIVIVLLVASLLSFIAGETIDAIAIILIILLDLVLGTIQEYNANKSAKALQNLIKVKSKVKKGSVFSVFLRDDI